MLLADEKLWKILEKKAKDYDEKQPNRKKSAPDFLSAVNNLATFAVDRAKTIRDVFPLYTLHDDTHIYNVIQIMTSLLHNKIEQASREEVAMLILAACCHDLGMSYTKEECATILEDKDNISEYLEKDNSRYVRAYTEGSGSLILSEDMKIDYFRSIHHERVKELLGNYEWPEALGSKVACQDLIKVCQSHGQDYQVILEMKTDATMDLRLCAIVLRLADILDFDSSRAPTSLYSYNDFHHEKISSSDKISLEEWEKHRSSFGFDFDKVSNRDKPFPLPFRATCENLQLEQSIISYLNWVDNELAECNKLLPYLEDRWKTLVLPTKVDRSIDSKGYESGQFKLTLEQNEVLNLLVGKAIYSDPAVFVRELLQNSIDAVRTRIQLDKSLSRNWKPQITVNTWLDNDGYHWFCINDNGLGMDKDIILNYFLKVGKSYYQSDSFRSEKLKSEASSDYMPISRFGIGILSCFMGDGNVNRVEVSTKRYEKDSPPLRLSMHGLNGYYCLTNKREGHAAPKVTDKKLEQHMSYRSEAGTTIAVRTNLYKTGKYAGFKEILDKYICYPEIPIHYEGKEGIYDYPTEAEFMQDLVINPDSPDNKNELVIPLSTEYLAKLKAEIPELTFTKPPCLTLKMFNLAELSNSPYLSGALLMAKTSDGEYNPFPVEIGEEQIETEVKASVRFENNTLYLGVELVFPKQVENRMRYIDEQIENNRYSINKAYNSLPIEKKYNAIQKELLNKFDYFIDCSDLWDIDECERKELCNKYELTLEELSTLIEGIVEDITEIECSLQNDDEERELIDKYKEINGINYFKMYNLATSEYYRKYFYRFENKERAGVIAHNGILCGDSALFCGDSSFLGNLGCLVLLKDKYRPEVDIARDCVKKLPLLALAHLDFIRHKFLKEFILVNKIESTYTKYLQYLPMQDYIDILDTNEEWLKELTFETEYGNVSVCDLHKMVETYQEVSLKKNTSMLDISYKVLSFTINIAIENLLKTILKKEFKLLCKQKYIEFSYIVSKKEKDLSPAHLYFPPAFFVQAIEGKSSLVNKVRFARYTCNENHPFSQFLLKNAELLRKQVPGIFERIIHTLAESNDLCKELNECIELLRNIPALQGKIPADLFISEKDFF